MNREEIKQWYPCHLGFKFWCAYCEGQEPVKQLEILLAEGHEKWANWLIVRMMTPSQMARYAIKAAERALPIWEMEYPDNTAPRMAITAVREWLQNPCDETEKAAKDAVWRAKEASKNAAKAPMEAKRDAAWEAEVASWAAGMAVEVASMGSKMDAAWVAGRVAEVVARLAVGVGGIEAERAELAEIVKEGINILIRGEK